MATGASAVTALKPLDDLLQLLVFMDSCCTKCKQARGMVMKQAGESPELAKHLMAVLSDKSLKFAQGETPNYDPGGKFAHTITIPHNLDPDDMADGLVFESFNASQRAEFTTMSDYKDEVVRWGTKRAEVEGITIKTYAETARSLKTRTKNMEKAVAKLELLQDKFVSTSLDTVHDSTATDMRCLSTKKLYIYQQITNLGTDQICSSLAKPLQIQLLAHLKYDGPKKVYIKVANCPAGAKYDEMLTLLNWVRSVWPSNLTTPQGKTEHRPRALLLILGEVQNKAAFSGLRQALTLAAFGLDDAQIKSVAETLGKDLNATKFDFKG